MSAEDRPVHPAEAAPEERPPGGGQGRRWARMLPAAATVALAAVLAIAALLPPEEGRNVESGRTAPDGSAQALKEQDFIRYDLSGHVDGENVTGTLTCTFRDLTGSDCCLTLGSTSKYYQNYSGTCSYHVADGVWCCHALTGAVLEGEGGLRRTYSFDSAFGEKNVTHYVAGSGRGTEEYYIAEGSAIPYVIVYSGPSGYIVLTISDTGIDRIRDL